MAAKTTTPPPVILFPLHGCRNVQLMTERDALAAVRKNRLALRKHWTNPGVQALISILEITMARLTAGAIAPSGTEHERGQAYGVNEAIRVVRSVVTGREDEAGEEEG